MTDDRPPIPAEVELEVRQRCGFACVVCGLPLYEYHHIRPWSEVPEHDPANIVLVCPNHHAEVTKGLLDPTTLESLSKCDKPSISTPHKMHYAGDTCKVYFGDSDWIAQEHPMHSSLLLSTMFHCWVFSFAMDLRSFTLSC